MKSLKRVSCLIGAGVLALTALPAPGQLLSDTMVVYTPPGSQLPIYAFNSIYENQEPMTAPSTIDDGIANSGLFGHATVFYEAGVVGSPTDVSTWSDVVGVVTTGAGHYALGFLSDPISLTTVGTFFGLPDANWTFIQEPSGSYNITGYLNPTKITQGYTAYFASDVEVPDGGLTVALLGFALVGVEGLRRKFRK